MSTSAGQSQPVSPSHLRFARSVRLARALRGIRVMRLLRCLGARGWRWGFGWKSMGKHVGSEGVAEIESTALGWGIWVQLVLIFSSKSGILGKIIRKLQGKKTSIFWVVFYIHLVDLVWIINYGWCFGLKRTELNGGLDQTIICKCWNFQQGILDQLFYLVVMWTPAQAGFYFYLCIFYGSSKMCE